MDLTPAEYEWTIEDVEGPDTSIVSMTELGPTDLVEPNSIRFQFTRRGQPHRVVRARVRVLARQRRDVGELRGDPLRRQGRPTRPACTRLQVRAVDEIGNVDPTPGRERRVRRSRRTRRSRSRTSRRPSCFATGETDATTVSFAFTSDNPNATFECSLTSSPTFEPCTSGTTYDERPVRRRNVFAVQAVAALGTRSFESAVFEWASGTFDPPRATILSASVGRRRHHARHDRHVHLRGEQDRAEHRLRLHARRPAGRQCESRKHVHGPPAGRRAHVRGAGDRAVRAHRVRRRGVTWTIGT